MSKKLTAPELLAKLKAERERYDALAADVRRAPIQLVGANDGGPGWINFRERVGALAKDYPAMTAALKAPESQEARP